jgi:hypothetical protein
MRCGCVRIRMSLRFTTIFRAHNCHPDRSEQSERSGGTLRLLVLLGTLRTVLSVLLLTSGTLPLAPQLSLHRD